jgi:hypothetical protein
MSVVFGGSSIVSGLRLVTHSIPREQNRNRTAFFIIPMSLEAITFEILCHPSLRS